MVLMIVDIFFFRQILIFEIFLVNEQGVKGIVRGVLYCVVKCFSDNFELFVKINCMLVILFLEENSIYIESLVGIIVFLNLNLINVFEYCIWKGFYFMMFMM